MTHTYKCSCCVDSSGLPACSVKLLTIEIEWKADSVRVVRLNVEVDFCEHALVLGLNDIDGRWLRHLCELNGLFGLALVGLERRCKLD